MTARGATPGPSPEAWAWEEYDSAADTCAIHGWTGAPGTMLPMGLSVRCHELINEDTDAFQERVRAFAYARAMENVK